MKKILLTATEYNPNNLIPVYCFDERQFNTTSFGFPKTGKFRAKFLLESVADLKQNLQKLGSDLIIRKGITEDIITDIAIKYKVDLVIFSQEATSEEKIIEKEILKKLNKEKIKVETVWQSTLYHPDELPFSLKDIPDLFTSFRKKVEKQSDVSSCKETPRKLPRRWKAK